jgi:hypothetical protein
LGEFRRSAQCYKEFRSPAVSKQITLVAQQNLAAGDQQVAYVEGIAANSSGKNGSHIEIEDNSKEEDNA